MNEFNNNHLNHSFIKFINEENIQYSNDYICAKCNIRILYFYQLEHGPKNYIEVNGNSVFFAIKLSCEEQIIKNIIE